MGKYDLNSILKDLKKSEQGSTNDFKSDFWKPTIEKGEDRVEYVIRFLPNPDAKTNFPWVERSAHMFNFPNNKFMYEPCSKRNKGKNHPCFICEEVDRMYKSGDPNQEKIGQKRCSKRRIFHNVLIVSDPRDGGKNEGKVMIYEAGQQIHDKCIEILENEELDMEERIYFHPTVGTNFKLIITRKSDYPNYEKSCFARKTTPLEVDGEELSEDEAEAFIEENAIKLNEKLLGEKAFKDYERLKDLYLNQGVASENSSSKEEKEEEEVGGEAEVPAPATKKVGTKATKKKAPEPEPEVDEDDEVPFDTDEDTDEDAELEALLND